MGDPASNAAAMRARPRHFCLNPGRPCHADCRSAGWAGALPPRLRREAASMRPGFEPQLPGRRACNARPPPNACTPPPAKPACSLWRNTPADAGCLPRLAALGVQARATGVPPGAPGAANSLLEARAGAWRRAPAQAWPARAGTCARRLRANAHSPMPVLARGRVIKSIESRRAHGV
jgi:hypothetical protein